MTRRSFMAAAAVALPAAGSPASDPFSNVREQENSIVARIRPPKFANRDFDVTKYGAKSGGTADCTAAIRDAIAACAAAGGGRVVIPLVFFSPAPFI